ncbi:LuxR C-terminal-related transcriptional regulator [Micromonospora sp. LOL_021]|uniref:LuxR C-terminal-related transcriptional regulator n=1 Tax=Micromonospora sp. LOL_021 TaxID=3345417 RepID=UPI003A84DC1F
MRTAGQETVAGHHHALRPTAPTNLDPVPLLGSKTAPPDPPAGLLDRPRLTARLEVGTRGPLTLLVAPAGWGKTALLAGWFVGRRARGSAIWLTLESADRGHRFWSYLHAALAAETARRHPDRPAPPAPGRADPELFLPRFASVIAAQPEPVLLVLDDAHTITDLEVVRGIEFLLRHCRGRLRLVAAGRTEPALALHRYRLTGELTEIRTAELALTLTESARLVDAQGLGPATDQIRELHHRAEGWPAGVRLAGLALQAGERPTTVREHVGADPDPAADYLSAEVLAGQAALTRQALVRTSVLDRVCGPLADELTGRDDGEEQLAAAARDTAGFIVAAGGDPTWYRCHRMLSDVLYAELSSRFPDEIPQLHERAYRWHRAHGRPLAAVRHGLACGDLPGAGQLVDEHWPELLLCGHEDARHTPLPTGLAPGHPGLALAAAVDRLETAGRLETACRLETAGRLAAGPLPDHCGPDPTSIATRLVVAIDGSRYDEALSYADELFATTGLAAMTASAPAGGTETLGKRARAVATAMLGTVRFGRGDLTGAEAVLTGLATTPATDGYGCPTRYAAGQLALLHARRGELTAADRAAQQALVTTACPGRRCAGHAAAAHLALALVALYRDELPDATRQLDLAAALVVPGTPETVSELLPVVQAALRQAEGDFAAVADLLTTTPVDRKPPDGQHGRLRRLALAEARMACGDLDGARELLLDNIHNDRAPAVAIALARLHLLADGPADALAVLPQWSAPDGGSPADPLVLRPERQPVTLLERLNAGLVAAVATHRMGDQRQARRLLEQVLDLAAPDGHRLVFNHAGSPARDLLVEHLDSPTRHRNLVTDLVDGAGRRHADRHRPAPALAEPLTDREMTVLRYLQGTLSNGEIAAELFLSVNTVKTHVRNIYQKLGAPRRREAVRRARELRLL